MSKLKMVVTKTFGPTPFVEFSDSQLGRVIDCLLGGWNRNAPPLCKNRYRNFPLSMKGIQSLDGTRSWGWNMDGVHEEEAEFIFNEHGTYRAKGTVVTDVIIKRVVMLMIIMAGDGNVEGRKVGRVWVPHMIRSHEELGYGGVFKEFVGGWLPCVKVGNGSQAVKGNDELGTGGDDGMRVKGAFSDRQVT